MLLEHFFEKANKKENLQVSGISNEVKQILEQYPWPGNIRELENVVYGMMVLAQGRQVEKEDLPERIKNSSGAPIDLEMGSDKTKTAESLGVSRKTLFNKMKAYGIE